MSCFSTIFWCQYRQFQSSGQVFWSLSFLNLNDYLTVFTTIPDLYNVPIFSSLDYFACVSTNFLYWFALEFVAFYMTFIVLIIIFLVEYRGRRQYATKQKPLIICFCISPFPVICVLAHINTRKSTIKTLGMCYLRSNPGNWLIS